MNVKSLNKWKELHEIIDGHLLEIKHTLDDYNHHYYEVGPVSNCSFHIEYDIDSDSCKFVNHEINECILELEGDNLNECTISQYLIEYFGK